MLWLLPLVINCIFLGGCYYYFYIFNAQILLP